MSQLLDQRGVSPLCMVSEVSPVAATPSSAGISVGTIRRPACGVSPAGQTRQLVGWIPRGHVSVFPEVRNIFVQDLVYNQYQ